MLFTPAHFGVPHTASRTMSSSHKIPHTITYSVAPTGDAEGPLFIAGTFSKPEWLLQEMHPSTPSEGLLNYSISIHVEPGKEYQYRFRHGREGAWTVDEKKDIGTFLTRKHRLGTTPC